MTVEKKRACERLLQVSVEAVIDACGLLVTGLRLGVPGEEDDLFEKLARRGVISAAMAGVLKRMKGLRNLLVHEYGRVNDELVFEAVRHRLGDFETFKREVLAFLRTQKNGCAQERRTEGLLAGRIDFGTLTARSRPERSKGRPRSPSRCSRRRRRPTTER